jgi:hypothetical protein
MTTEQLPDGLQLAVEIIESTLAGPNARARARSAIRAEHAQRLTLQHHAADQAQRITDLERLNSMHKAAWLAYQPLGDYMQALSTAGELPTGTLGRHLGDVAIERMQAQEARIAELEAERDEWRRIASAYSPTKELADVCADRRREKGHHRPVRGRARPLLRRVRLLAVA